MAVVYPVSDIPENVSLVVVSSVLVFMASAAVGLRIWARRLTSVGLNLDDYFIILSLALLYSLYVIAFLDVVYGMRRNIADLPAENLTILLKILIPYQLLYGTVMVAVKLSYLTFFYRIFGVQSYFKAWALGLMTVVTCWWVANVLQVFLVCRPLKINWSPFTPGVCGNRALAFVLLATFNIITDIGILMLPLPYIRALQMETKKKWGLAAMFSIGLLITAISGVRLSVLAKLSFDNISYDMLDSVFWTVIEPSVSIMNACLPMMRIPLQRVIPALWSTTSGKTGDSHIPQTIGSTAHRRTPSRAFVDDDEIQLTKLEKEGMSASTIPIEEEESDDGLHCREQPGQHDGLDQLGGGSSTMIYGGRARRSAVQDERRGSQSIIVNKTLNVSYK